MVWHHHVSVRLMVPILGALALSIGGAILWLGGRQEDRILERGREQATLVNEVVKASLRNQMLRRTADATQDTIERIQRGADLAEITLLDKTGLVRYASDASRRGEREDRANKACAACHAGGAQPERDTRLVETSDGRRVFRSMSLIANEPECRACHGGQERFLGVLAVDQDVGRSLAAIAEDRAALTGIGAGTLALVVALVGLIVLFLVQRPVSALVRGTRRVRERDLDTRIEVGVRGELGELAGAFNAMVADTKSYVEDIQRKRTELATLYAFVERVSRSIDLGTLRRIIADLLVESFPGAVLGAVVLRPLADAPLEIAVRRGEAEGTEVLSVDARDERRLAEIAEPEVLSRWLAGGTREPAVFDRGAGRAFPLRAGDSDVGLIVLRRAAGATFSEAEEHLLLALASHVAVAVRNARLYTLAVTDELTGLYAHRFFQQALAREADRYRRYGRCVSLLMLDVDELKHVNDEHGHPAGDRCLREVASVVRRCVRDVDVACRYGGEEFAVILSETDARSAAAVAERIRAEVEAESFATDRWPAQVTVSIGVAACPDDATTAEELLDAADRALYAAKRAGKNRVACAARAAAAPSPTAT